MAEQRSEILSVTQWVATLPFGRGIPARCSRTELAASHALFNREGKKRKLADMMDLENQVSDFRRCVPYLLYYGDVSEEAFGLPVDQMRPFGVRIVAYPRRDDLKHLQARGVIGFFMGPGDCPSMDRVYVKSTTKSTVR